MKLYFNDQKNSSQGILSADFSFLTNNTSDPATTSFRGCGGLTGSAGATSVSNSGPSVVSSITRTGVGAYLITLADGYRFVQAYDASIDDGADQLQARIGTISNEGSGNTTAVTLALTVRSAGTATESTGRRISVFLRLKTSGNGS